MSKDPNFPAMKWHPQTGEVKLCHKADDVPEGWIDTHPANLANVAQPAPVKLPMKRKDIVAALSEGGITFDVKSPTYDLYALLVENLKAALTEAEIEFAADADANTLLGLLPKPE